MDAVGPCQWIDAVRWIRDLAGFGWQAACHSPVGAPASTIAGAAAGGQGMDGSAAKHQRQEVSLAAQHTQRKVSTADRTTAATHRGCHLSLVVSEIGSRASLHPTVHPPPGRGAGPPNCLASGWFSIPSPSHPSGLPTLPSSMGGRPSPHLGPPQAENGLGFGLRLLRSHIRHPYAFRFTDRASPSHFSYSDPRLLSWPALSFYVFLWPPLLPSELRIARPHPLSLFFPPLSRTSILSPTLSRSRFSRRASSLPLPPTL